MKAIEDDYPAPKGFTSTAERQQKQAAKEASDRHAAEVRRQEREQEARERAEKAAILAYREALTPVQLKQLEADALTQASEEQRNHFESATPLAMQRMYLGSIRDAHILAILKAQNELPFSSNP